MNHSHNNNDQNQHSNHDSKHMWWMMLACMAPILFILFSGRGAGNKPNWTLVAVGIGMLALHIFGMRGHGHKKEEPTNK